MKDQGPGEEFVRIRIAKSPQSLRNRFTHREKCFVCGHTSVGFSRESENYREDSTCRTCSCLHRENQVAGIILRHYSSRIKGSIRRALRSLGAHRIHEFGYVGSLNHTLRKLESFSCSDFFPGVPVGAIGPAGIQCQDIQALLFESCCFDLVISQDVFEHVENPQKGFEEIHRVLKPGGRHIFTVPFDLRQEFSTTRAALNESGEIIYLQPAVYHGDPHREEGALVFTDFGRDLFTQLHRAGFKTTLYEVVEESQPGGYIGVIDSLKP